MVRRTSSVLTTIDPEAVDVLLSATLDFLKSSGISDAIIAQVMRDRRDSAKRKRAARKFWSVVGAYEEMGIIMSTWFTEPQFLNDAGQPLALDTGSGRKSLSALVRASNVRISPSAALRLLRQSTSATVTSRGRVLAVKRAFILPQFEIPRATLIIQRFLETLRRNSAAQWDEHPLLLERCCYVTGVNARSVAPIMRDIRGRGAAFMDSVDGEIEAHRLRKSSRAAIGEMGVVTFAWTHAKATRGSQKSNRERRTKTIR